MVAFRLFGRAIYWYGIFYFVTFLAGYAFLYWIKTKKLFQNYKGVYNLIQNGLDDLFLIVILGVLIGGRLGYVLIYAFDRIDSFYEVFMFWEGGMSFVGGSLGVIVGILFIAYKYKWNYKDFLLMFDLILIVVCLGIGLGRIGNFLNQELYGKPISNLGVSENGILAKLGLVYEYDSIDSQLRLNSNFIESILQGFVPLIVALGLFIKKYLVKNFKPGYITSFFLINYGIVRFITEYLRDYSESEWIWMFTKTQYFMILFVLLGLGIIYKLRKIEI